MKMDNFLIDFDDPGLWSDPGGGEHLPVVLLPVVHHLGHQHDHRQAETHRSGYKDTSERIESDALTVVQNWTRCSPGRIPKSEMHHSVYMPNILI